MATPNIINIPKLSRDLNRIQGKLDKMEDIATTRALNIILNQEEKRIAAEISAEYGISQAAVRKMITKKKATKNRWGINH